ncbi:MAG: alpha-galactosidase [Defluviitaleaceae bacterium]|nr:alpha-galactosidase [Defluviitaleaceae bacterium]
MSEPYIKVFASGEGIEARRYVSGAQVLDEGLINGRLVSRYRNASGQVVPEMHLHPDHLKYMAEKYGGAQVFILHIGGKNLDGGWRTKDFYERESVFVNELVHDEAQVAVNVCTKMHGSDFFIRWLEIKNISEKPCSIDALSPYAGHIWTHRFWEHCEITEFAEENPFEIAYNHRKTWGHEGDFYFDPIEGGEFFYCNDQGKSGWTRPACWLRDVLTGETLVCELAWSGNWQLRVNTSSGEYERLSFEIGMLTMEGEALRVLAPGETCVSPAVHFGLFRCCDDEIVQRTHAHVRANVLPALPSGVPLSEIEANHRGYLCDRENEAGIKRDIDVANAAEAEMYVIDAGWFGSGERNNWGNNVGDWTAGHWLPKGLRDISDYAHEKGMRFGLWIEAEAAGHWSKLREDHPEWLAKRSDGELCAGGRALDLSLPEVEKFVYETIRDAIINYKLDMYRIDHNHNIGLGPSRDCGGINENKLWLYYEAFYRIFDRLRAEFPQTVFQNCAGGGGRLDWGTLSRFHNTELSDWMRQPRDVRVLNGVTMSLPPEILLRTLGTEVGEMPADADIHSQFRKSMICRPIYRGIAPSVEELTPFLLGITLKYNSLYKYFIRPLMENCLVYHHTPFQPVKEAAENTVLEYFSADKKTGLMAVFTSTPGEHFDLAVFPRGVSRSKTYLVTFDNSGERVILSGWQMINDGLAVPVGWHMGSELILFQEAN